MFTVVRIVFSVLLFVYRGSYPQTPWTTCASSRPELFFAGTAQTRAWEVTLAHRLPEYVER